jgi:phospholipid/cholesterol/gamma-HCH transport system substrate-binding protein
VVPGQGQTVNIAGVKVGEIGKVRLEDGRAVVQMKIRRKYTPIHKDATVLLRPKTGLKDMYMELDPGSPKAGTMKAEGTIPVGNTAPDVNPDEVFAELDADTRAYLRILLNSGSRAFEGDAPAELRETFKRFEPTGRDLRKINGLLAQRRTNLRRVMHNFQLLATELGSKDRQVASFVDSSNANFEAIASQEQSLRQALGLLPGTLTQTRDTLRDVDSLASNLGPALRKLRPGARALGPSLRATRPFLRATTPVIKNELRPFARDVRPTVRDLRPAARDLAVATPRLKRTFGVLNQLLNALAYNPPGREEGFSFWLSWGAPNGASLFALQDAHGPARRGLVLVSCSGLEILDQLKAGNRLLGTSAELLNIPDRATICPGAPASAAGKKSTGTAGGGG